MKLHSKMFVLDISPQQSSLKTFISPLSLTKFPRGMTNNLGFKFYFNFLYQKLGSLVAGTEESPLHQILA